jgi:ABC-type multidrug transport system ATPase subunit
MLTKPKIFFLDEPTSGLDARSAMSVMNLLGNMTKSKGVTVLITIHQPRIEMWKTFDRVLLMCYGKVAHFGMPNETLSFFEKTLQSRPESRKLAKTTNPADSIIDVLSDVRLQIFLMCSFIMTEE